MENGLQSSLTNFGSIAGQTFPDNNRNTSLHESLSVTVLLHCRESRCSIPNRPPGDFSAAGHVPRGEPFRYQNVPGERYELPKRQPGTFWWILPTLETSFANKLNRPPSGNVSPKTTTTATTTNTLCPVCVCVCVCRFVRGWPDGGRGGRMGRGGMYDLYLCVSIFLFDCN